MNIIFSKRTRATTTTKIRQELWQQCKKAITIEILINEELTFLNALKTVQINLNLNKIQGTIELEEKKSTKLLNFYYRTCKWFI